MSITEYNEKQAKKYGWTPEWFGVKTFGDELTHAVMVFQRSNGLKADGYCGPSTYRRKWTDIESQGDFIPDPSIEPGDKYIVHNGRAVEIFWDNVVLWTEGKKRMASHYTSRAGKEERKPTMFMTHWDVCLTSASCFSVLEKRNLSVHFGLDCDKGATIHQWLDTQHIAYHAGGSLNPLCIGVEVNTAYSLKYQQWYEDKGFGTRPIWKDAKVHGKTLKPFLGFYDRQVKALAALWEATSYAAGIPLQLPENKYSVDPAVQSKIFKGYVNHFNATAKKIDCAGLDNEMVLRMAKDLRKKRLSQK